MNFSLHNINILVTTFLLSDVPIIYRSKGDLGTGQDEENTLTKTKIEKLIYQYG